MFTAKNRSYTASRAGCFCGKVKEYLSQKQIQVDDRDITKDLSAILELQEFGFMTTPVTVVDDKVILGFDVPKLGDALNHCLLWEDGSIGLDMIKLLFGFVLFAATLVASAQMDTSLKKPVTDQQKIADALRAGPAFVAKDAVIADWPADPKDPNAEYRILRPGTSNWTCLPGFPGYPHDEPMCLDNTSMRWIKDSLAGRPVHIAQIGVMYMYTGAWVQDVHGTSHSKDHTYHVGPHVMIITPHNEDLATFSHDGSDGQPYVAHLPGHSELYLVMPYQDLPQQ